MEDKLQLLTDKIYNEGVEKANKEAEKILDEARKKAGEILKKAKIDEIQIKEEALKFADDLKKNVFSEIKLSGQQAINALKQEVTNLIKTKVIDKPLSESFNDVDFVKQIIETAINNWNPTDSKPVNLTILLPSKLEKEFSEFIKLKAAQVLKNKVTIEFDRNLVNGFKIGPSDDSYRISFSEKDFDVFFQAYLRPKMIELLYS